MAASSSTIQIIDDDDDDFDWEAAVEAIDRACHTTINPNSIKNAVHKPPVSTKQSTLDKFIGTRTPKPLPDDSNNVTDSSHRNSVVVEQGDSNCVKIDPEAAKTWIYPVNVPLRDYQFAITKTCLFSNTLVTLPTGLGKTLIAAVVMYNYFRWFPEGKIVFTAPSKPLVMQQIEACHNIVGIPQEWTIDLTGEMSPIKRVSFWEAKRVFFVTPQVLEKDIESGGALGYNEKTFRQTFIKSSFYPFFVVGKCLVGRIVCLVIDEAHRATGNYSYCVVVRKLIADNVQLRILALTATPGSKHLAIQKIIDNLQISTLEYRNESDHDVLPYVHEKKIELIKVAMGQDVVDADNLLSEVMGYYCKKLCSLGVLRIRDSKTLSPCELLDSKARFLEVPPGNVPHPRHGEILGDITLLLKLVHIRKLLTGYGIGPALEMLEDKFKEQGNCLNRNEAFQKLKVLMKQSLCSGATSPKLSKMLEVLIDHFKKSDPLNSRVIIFSNYRGSVRAIMEALANIGHIVKATQFIGQSSGKTSKGQSQKIQQEVLQKFRAGGYNVIVATSIGEEGLDIMEVDLVLCFDADVSPLRMIQRMGRTGRNHAGRVVVLSCEGREYNSYLQKQKSCQNIHKQLRNGGRTGFNFSTSPRMIPHIYKPEVQYVELSIKQFIPRGKNVLDDHTVQLPTFEDKLNNNEIELLRKFFQPKDNFWRPSLIAFPHFQAFPSRVHNVMHSFRSNMLIDTMQYLQGSSYSRDSRACFDQVEANSDLSVSIETVEQHDSFLNEMQTFHDPGKENSQREVSESHVSPLNPFNTEEKRCFTHSRGAKTSVHSYLFGSDFVSVDVLGRVLVLSVPLPPLKDVHSKCTNASTAGLQNCYNQNAAQVGDSLAECKIETKQVNYFDATPTVREGNDLVDMESSDSDMQQERLVDVDFKVSQTPICSRKLVKEKISEALPVGEHRAAVILSDDSGNGVEDVELSPRLTSLLKSGVVPESPTNDTGTLGCKWKDEILSKDRDLAFKEHTEPILYHSVIAKNDIVIQDNNAGEDLTSCAKDEIPLSANNGNNVSAVNYAVFPVMEEIETPAEKPLPNSCSEEWHLTSGDNSESVKNGQKFKRLRKYGDLLKKRPRETNQYECVTDAAELGTSTCSKAHKRGRSEKRMTKDVRVFIEEQAEVSGEILVSEDEDEEENNSCNDSFIDDRINPTAGCTSAEDSGRDMMAIYRRSLLSQSPMGRPPIAFMNGSPNSSVNRTQIYYSGSSEGTNRSLQTPQAVFCPESTGWNSVSSRLKPETNAESMFNGSNDTQKEDESNVGSRKRKLSSCQVGPLPVQNLDGKFMLQSEAQAKDRSHTDWMNKDNPVTTEFDDDQFYDGIDLDALEEQATKYLRSKSNLSTQNQMKNPDPENHADLREEPSFDLGI